MTEEKLIEDPELFDDEEEGAGNEGSYVESDYEVEFDPAQFELPDDFEYSEEDEGDDDGSNE